MNTPVLGFAGLLFLAVSACTPTPTSPVPDGPSPLVRETTESPIGYASVADALTALKARRDVDISVRDRWTIVSDPTNNAFWSFTPPSHPAHPAAVKRTILERDGAFYVLMTALCQAEKFACDKLVAEFQVLNERMRQDIAHSAIRRRATPPFVPHDTQADGSWSPSETDKAFVEHLTHQYFLAKDQGRYQDAYAMLSPGMQEITPFERWSTLEQEFSARAGRATNRQLKKVTWYKDPPTAPTPGIYAAVDYTGRFENIDVYCGYVAWKRQENGTFRLVRQEQNFVDKETQRKMDDRTLAAIKAQFGC